MSSVHHLHEISPPPVASADFVFWRWLPNWHNHYGCPDCIKTSAESRLLLPHLRAEHPRWRPFIQAREAIIRPPPIPRARLWKDPEFRARHAAAVRDTLAKRWKDPEFRARHAAAVREGTERYWADRRAR